MFFDLQKKNEYEYEKLCDQFGSLVAEKLKDFRSILELCEVECDILKVISNREIIELNRNRSNNSLCLDLLIAFAFLTMIGCTLLLMYCAFNK